MSLWQSPEAVAGWRKAEAARAQAFTQATDAMLRLARIGSGDRVLDVAAGSGDEALAAAALVGPEGQVLATDVSEPMLDAAAARAAEAGLQNLTTRVLAGEAVAELGPNSFDAVISRLGLMFVSDLDASLRAVASVLRPGGRVAAVVWDDLALNPFLGAPVAALENLGRKLPPGSTLARAFGLGGDRLARALERSGFVGVEGGPVPANRSFRSVEEVVEALRTSPASEDVIAALTEDERERLWSIVAQSLRRFESPQGVELPGVVRVYAGTRP